MEDEYKEDGAGGDRSTASRVYRLIRDMFDSGKKGKKRRVVRQRRFGKGPDRERDTDMDVEADSDDEGEGTLSMVDVRARVLAAGFTEMDLMSTVTEVSGSCVLPRQKHHRLTSEFCSTKDWKSSCEPQTVRSFKLSTGLSGSAVDTGRILYLSIDDFLVLLRPIRALLSTITSMLSTSGIFISLHCFPRKAS